MRSSFSYQVAIWLPSLSAFLLSIAHGSGHFLLVGLVQGALFFLAVRSIIRWEQHLDKTSVASWLFFVAIGITVLLSGLFWVFRDLAV